MGLIEDENGNHVIQKCVEYMDSSLLDSLVGSLQGQVAELCVHPFGCRVIQRILEHCNQTQVDSVLREVHFQSKRLIKDQYGNYVIQYILTHGWPGDKAKVIGQLKGCVTSLAQHKYASNVVEKAIECASIAERRSLVSEIIEDDQTLINLTKHPFGNYVLQRILESVDVGNQRLLLSRLYPHLGTLKKYNYARYVIGKMEMQHMLMMLYI